VHKKTSGLLKSIVLIAGGVIVVATGAWIAFDGYRFLEGAGSAPGRVIDMVTKRGSRGMTFYHPVVRFQPIDADSSIEFAAGASPWKSLYLPGDRVDVAYNVANPAEARIRSFWMMWFLPIVTALLGAVSLLVGWHEWGVSRR
jgi:hypothetical protein